MIWLAVLIQVALPAPAAAAEPPAVPVETRADGSQRWSIKTCDSEPKPGEVLVCGRRSQDEYDGPAPGRGANRELSGAKALALQDTPCAARVGGCQVGFNILGPPTMLVRAIQKLVDPNSDCCEGADATNPLSLVRDVVTGVKRGRAPKPDKANRVPIVLDDLPPAAAAVSETPVDPALTPKP